MSMRPVFDPTGGPDTLVDKMLGNAYDVVKAVAHNLSHIRHVSDQLENVYKVSQDLDAIKSVAENIDSVVELLPYADDVAKVAHDLPKVVTVANNINELIALYQSLPLLLDVQRNLPELLDIHSNLERIIAVFDALPVITLAANLTGVLGAVGTTTNIPLGSVTKAKITGMTLVVTGIDGNLYFPSTTLSFAVVGTNVAVVLAAGAPATLAGGTAKVHVTYTD